MSGGTPFPIDPVLVGIVSAYQNPAFIADMISPRVEPRLDKEMFSWWEFEPGQFITLQDTKVGRKSEPNTVEFNATEKTSRTDDYGIDDVVPVVDSRNAPAGFDPKNFAAQALMDLVLMDREVRVATKTFTAANYGANNKETLAGSSKWSHVDSKPVIAINAAADRMVVRPKHMVLGRSTWSALRTNPSVLRSLTVSGAGDGMANLRAVADLLELDDIYVGDSWVNSAKPGQPVQRIRAWGGHACLFHKAPMANSVRPNPTFSYTVQFGERVSVRFPSRRSAFVVRTASARVKASRKSSRPLSSATSSPTPPDGGVSPDLPPGPLPGGLFASGRRGRFHKALQRGNRSCPARRPFPARPPATRARLPSPHSRRTAHRPGRPARTPPRQR